jgi:DNA invertase Pin-like site-specific DNA recombinase
MEGFKMLNALETQETQYIVDLYLRLSKADGDNEESESIENQRSLLLDFLKSMPNVRLNKIRIDDGYSGVDFNRPDFIKMLDDIKAGVVNCVIVKDFSRFGRNYIESGKYIQQLFPRTGVRFIAVTDCYDSEKVHGYTGNIIVPFKNMVNDAYSADISMKVRSHLDIKRKRGEFVGSFATYGYVKDPEPKNKLVIAAHLAADVVRDIFRWKLEGLSAQCIADRLNAEGVLSPMEYKRYCGSKFKTTFKVNASAKWQSKAVTRILTNEVYLGIVEHGKRVKPNYKVRKRTDVPKEQWTRAENAHEPIIDRLVFDTVQGLLKQDTRASAKNTGVRPLSGVIVCADCGAAMVHKTNTNKSGKKYGYYVCSKHRADTSVCSTHLIATADCENAVLQALRLHTSALLDMERLVKSAENLPYQQDAVRKLTARLEAKRDEITRNMNYRLSLHESYTDGILPKEDFISFKSSYDVKIADAEAAALALQEEIENLAANGADNRDWIARFREYIGADALIRKIVAELVDKVSVYNDGRLEVTFRYMNEYARLAGAAGRAA